MLLSSALLATLLAATAKVAARDVPANVRSFYNKVKAQNVCPNQLQGGFHSVENDNKGIVMPNSSTASVEYVIKFATCSSV